MSYRVRLLRITTATRPRATTVATKVFDTKARAQSAINRWVFDGLDFEGGITQVPPEERAASVAPDDTGPKS